jgi:hypothetical protein
MPRVRSLIAPALVGLVALAGCTGGEKATAGTTSGAADTRSDAAEPTISRDTEVAVRGCIEAHLLIGKSLLIDPHTYDPVNEVCDNASLLLDVDDDGANGPTITNDMALKISERMVEVARINTLPPEQKGFAAYQLDQDYDSWRRSMEVAVRLATL